MPYHTTKDHSIAIELIGKPVTNPEPLNTSALALDTLKLLADDTRWKLLQALRHSDRQATELATLCQVPNNLVSYHLGLLRQAGLVQIHRSDADARVFYYGLDLTALQLSYRQIGSAFLLPEVVKIPTSSPATVVFLCTHNSARSQMAEGWLRHLSAGTLIARSAGVTPTNLHPMAVQAMAEVGIDIGYQRAKGLDNLEGHPDIVVTVCDLAREQCSAELQRLPALHWSITDPVKAKGEEGERFEVFRNVRDQLRIRVQGLLSSISELLKPLAPAPPSSNRG
jgi:protein-tyrosine-phosphatase